MSPFDPSIAKLSGSQLYWIILNHNKDQEEDLVKFKMLAFVTNPEIAKQVFSEANSNTEVSKFDEEELIKDIRSHSSDNLTDEQIKERLSIANSDNAEQLDIIERVE